MNEAALLQQLSFSVKYLDCNVSGYQELRGILISEMELVSPRLRSSLYSTDSHPRKNINPIQVINVNLGFSKNLALPFYVVRKF